ncbi:MAG: hypothetical protein MPN21_13485 [Thermoanaerobaculia bacterium]|nr:hypothetical protein [Thermoanaerobaculia bacterium]
MTFGALWTLLLVPLWLALYVRFGRVQIAAVRWIEEHIGPRFRRRLTAWSHRSSRRHVAFLAVLMALLVAAATGPAWLGGDARVRNSGRLLLAIDASASMLAQDVPVRGQEERVARFEVAKQLAAELADDLGDWQVGLSSWSGVATAHLPLHRDVALTKSATLGLRHHSLYRSSGSSFESILDVALRFHDPEENALQVLLFSDGEMPKQELYDEALAALVEAGIVVHAVGLGGTKLHGMVVWDPQDLGKPEEERRVLKEFQTQRRDEHLARITRATGGRFMVPDLEFVQGDDGPIAELAGRWGEWLREVEVDVGADQRRAAKRDLGAVLLALFLLGVLLDLHGLGRGRGGTPTFRLDAVGRRPERGLKASSLAVLIGAALLPSSCGDGGLWNALGGTVWKAHRANEMGIQFSDGGRHEEAGTRFVRSAAFGVDPEIPTYNHARSRTLAEDFAAAHELNETALELAPGLDEARFNDGVLLYRWGTVEAHPQGCELGRTLDLWKSAQSRFDDVAESAKDPDLRRRAQEQAETVRREIARLEQLVADPPAPCRSESEAPSDDPEDESDESNEGGGSAEPPPAAGEPPPQTAEPPSSEPPAAEPPPASGSTAPSSPDRDGGSQEPKPNGSGGAVEVLSGEELQEVLAELDRIRNQALEEGKYHHRSAAEQVDEESFGNPDDVWW